MGHQNLSSLFIRETTPCIDDISGASTKQLPCVALNRSKNHQLLSTMEDLDPNEERQPSSVYATALADFPFAFTLSMSAERPSSTDDPGVE